MTFKGREPVRRKIVIDKKNIEQVNYFNYLGNFIPHDKELDVDKKIIILKQRALLTIFLDYRAL